MDLNEIAKGCKERGLEELFEFLKPMAKNAIKIDTQAKDDGDIAIGASKFGGQPDLPASVSWPSNENGALSFVAQINFAEVSKFDTDGLLPKSGMLYLFYDINLRIWGYDPADKKGFAVIFSEAAKDQLVRQNMDSGNFTFGARSLSFRNELNLPSL